VAHGFARVTGVVPDRGQLASWKKGAREFIASLGFPTDFSVADVVYDRGAWPLHGCPGPFGGYGAGQLPAAWEARLHARVRAVWGVLWGTEALVTSADALCAERPRRHGLRDATALTLHVERGDDADEETPGAAAAASSGAQRGVQGVLSLTATRERTGGTSVVARSHALLDELFLAHPPPRFCAAFPPEDAHLLTVSAAQLRWLLHDRGCELVHVESEPGDLVLFDERTVRGERRARDALPHTDWRFAFHIAMTPADRLDAADRAAKARAMGLAPQRPGLRRAETTSHHADGRRIRARFGRWEPYPPGAAAKEGLLRAPACVRNTPEALQLAGVEPYVTTMTIDDDDDAGGAADAEAAARLSPPREVAARTRGAKARASGGGGEGRGGNGSGEAGGGRALRSRRSGSMPQERGGSGGSAGRQREQVIVIDD
jgi:ectoine hydroxylase-related dioxygenase (phytanoyl-CoA dioxygenase family)